VLRIFGPKREELAGGWRKLHNEELHNLYTSPNIIRVIKSRMEEMSRACSMHGDMGMHEKLWSEDLKGRNHTEDIHVDGKIILEW
jgi:hypothetical protein